MQRMINVKITTLVLVLVLLLAGCAQPTPVVIYVTPTSEGAATDETTADIAQAATVVLPTDQIVQPTTVPTDDTPTLTPGPTMTFMGSIIGDDYVPPATNTPAPTTPPEATGTPPPLPTNTPGPAPEETEEVTEGPTLVPTGTVMPNIDTSDVGIQVASFLTNDDKAEVLKQVDNDMQLGWIKLQIAWDFFQPNGPGEVSEDLRRIEIFIEQIRLQRQVNVLVSIAKAPDWARSDTTEDGPPDDPQALADFITLLLNETNGAIGAVEVWNEPNLAREWRGQPLSGASYMRYFDVGYRAVKAYNPNVMVVSAGLAPTGDTEFTRNDRAYLREMYAAGLANYDGIAVGVHPYGWGNPPDARCCDLSDERGWDDAPQFFFLDTIDDYREIMVTSGHSGAQMWLTEFGWATWEGLPGEPPDVWMTYNSKWDQANYGLRAIQIAQSRDDIGPMFLWNLNFAQPILIDQRDERIAYSIVLPEGQPKERPLYWMLYDASRPDEQLPRFD